MGEPHGISRRTFLAASAVAPWTGRLIGAPASPSVIPADRLSDFERRLRPLNRILELEDWYVWGTSPIDGPDGKVHVFFSRWPAERRMGGWINRSEIAHAVAEKPEGPYAQIETVLAPRGAGFWDATTCHNPHIRKVDDRYCLFYMGNSNGKTNTKRVGLATADSLWGPWRRMDQPLIETSGAEAWDNHCTSNPSFVRHPNGQYWLYYKSWNSSEYYNSAHPTVRGNRKYGLAIADRLEGPYVKYAGNPIIDYSGRGDNTQIEDACVYREDGKFRMIARDMGIFNHQVGLYLASDDGIHWSEPQVAYQAVKAYIDQPPGPRHLRKYGRFERPQLLLRDGHPACLFVTSQGGRHMNASAFVFALQ